MEISKILNLDKPTSLVLLKNGKEKLLLTTELKEYLNKQLNIHSVSNRRELLIDAFRYVTNTEERAIELTNEYLQDKGN